MKEKRAKRCFLVIGPESSGNKLIARILIDAGCYGDASTQQRLDKTAPPEDINDIVLVRSFPHGAEKERHFPNLATEQLAFQKYGFNDFMAIVTVRDMFCTSKSQVLRGHVNSEAEALQNIPAAYGHIYSQLGYFNIPSIHITYESLIHFPTQTILWLTTQLGLKNIRPNYITDENQKWLLGIYEKGHGPKN